MKFLHTADWQIGRMYSQFDSGDALELASARIEGVRRIAALACEHAVDAVLVAGDIFDTQTPRDKTILRLFEAMAGYTGPWLLLPGNHDAALPESVWHLARRLQAVPANVIPCLQPQALVVTGAHGKPFSLLPAPLTQRHTHTDLTAWFDHADTPEGQLRIGMAHGSVAGILADEVDSPNPIAPDRAARARLDYLALGDWHGRKQVDARTWYSGTHEPERFRDNEPGWVLLVEIDAPGALPRVTPLATARFRWQRLELQVHSQPDADAAIAALEEIGRTVVADVVLAGTCDMATRKRLVEALAAAQRRAAAVTLNEHRLELAPTEADLHALRANGFVGDALNELKAQLQGPGADVARDALMILARLQRQGAQGEAAA